MAVLTVNCPTKPLYTKHSKLTIYMSTDIETGGFNGPQRNEEGNIVQGAEVNTMLQIATMFLDTHLREYQGTAFEAMLQPPINEINNPDTWAFHVKNGFVAKWDDAFKIDYASAENVITGTILDLLKLNGVLPSDASEVPEYSYDNKFEIIILGKSVNFDRTFLNYKMPKLAMLLHHQTADTSSAKALMRGVANWPKKITDVPSTHFAMDDVKSANAEARCIRRTLSLPLPKGMGNYYKEAIEHLPEAEDRTLYSHLNLLPKHFLNGND